MSQSVRAIAPTLAVIDGTPTTTSNEVAQHFGKQHKHVLDKIAALLADLPSEFAEPNFRLSEFTDSTGRALPAYRLTRDGFTLLAMGFTGKKALTFKLAYIAAFNAMEAKLRGTGPAALPYSVQPDQTLSAEEADLLRDLIKQHAETLPKEERARFVITAWSKLKAHFKTDYRHIPADQFTEAVSLLGRHMALTDTPRVTFGQNETLNDLCDRLARQLLTSNGYPLEPFIPLYDAISKKIAARRGPLLGVLPMEQLQAIFSRLNRLSMLFHPFSEPFADTLGVIRALRGCDPKLGMKDPKFLPLVDDDTYQHLCRSTTQARALPVIRNGGAA